MSNACRNVTFVTPRVGAGEDAGDWVKSICNADTAVMYMAAGQAAAIAGQLIGNGLPADMPVVIVENASLSDAKQTATTLGRLQNATESMTHGGPALLMIGRVFERAAGSQFPAIATETLRLAAAAARSA